MNQIERNEWQRLHRKSNGNSDTKKYEKTVNGFLMRLYRNMQSRVTGVQKLKHHLYFGKELLDRESFYTWAKTNTTFLKLFEEWELDQYPRRTTPSVDRVNSALGYTINNMEWVVFHENCRRGSISKKLNKEKIWE